MPFPFRDLAPTPPLVPKLDPAQPDYDALAALPNTFQPPDNAGEIAINPDEAAALRNLGWSGARQIGGRASPRRLTQSDTQPSSAGPAQGFCRSVVAGSLALSF